MRRGGGRWIRQVDPDPIGAQRPGEPLTRLGQARAPSGRRRAREQPNQARKQGIDPGSGGFPVPGEDATPGLTRFWLHGRRGGEREAREVALLRERCRYATFPVNLYGPRDMRNPMMAYESFHDTSNKRLLESNVLPGGGTAVAEMKVVLDMLFNHPNVAPFISQM